MDVSYVIPLYNKEKFLPFLCEGLRSQRGNFTREYVFVDDGSSDNTVENLRVITAAWENVVIICQKNGGPSAALNRAFAHASGVYVKPLDCDDMLLPWATEYLLRVAEQTGAEFITATRSDQLSYNCDESVDALAMPSEPSDIGQKVDMLPLSLRSSQTQPSLWLARLDAIRQTGGSDEGVFVQDYSIELNMALRGNVAVVAGPVVRIGCDSGQLSNNEAQVLHDCNAAIVRFLARNPNLPAKFRRMALKRAAGRAWRWASRKGGAAVLSATHRQKFYADLGILTLTPETSAHLCQPFIDTNNIRIPHAAASSTS